MPDLPKSLSILLERMREVTSNTQDKNNILAAIETPLATAALDPDWFRPEFLDLPDRPGFSTFVLHQEPDHSLAIIAVAWTPGGNAPPHDHGTWGLVAGVRGRETNITWQRIDDGSRPDHAELVQQSQRDISRGEVVRLSSRDIHSVTNQGAEPSLSLHAYGRHLNHTARHRFDLKTQTMHPFLITPR